MNTQYVLSRLQLGRQLRQVGSLLVAELSTRPGDGHACVASALDRLDCPDGHEIVVTVNRRNAERSQ
jgi:hypothetical protein